MTRSESPPAVNSGIVYVFSSPSGPTEARHVTAVVQDK